MNYEQTLIKVIKELQDQMDYAQSIEYAMGEVFLNNLQREEAVSDMINHFASALLDIRNEMTRGK